MDTPTLKCPRSGRILTPLSMDYWQLKKKINRIISDSSTSDEKEEETPLKRPLDRRKELTALRDGTPPAPPLQFTSASRKPVPETPKENRDPSLTDVKSRQDPSLAGRVRTPAAEPADSENSDDEDIVFPVRRRRRAQKFSFKSSSSDTEEQDNGASSASAQDETEKLSKALLSTRIGSPSPPSSGSDARPHAVIEISSDDDDRLSSDAKVGVKEVKHPPLQQSNPQNRQKTPVTEPKNRTGKGINRGFMPPPSAPPKSTREARVRKEGLDGDDSDFDELLEKLRNRKHEDDVYDESQVDLNNTVCEWEESNADERRFLESLDEEKVPLASCHKDALPYRKSKFNVIKDDLATKLFNLYHGSVFQNRFEREIPITWNVHMRKTAGFCYYLRHPNGSKSARIELSPKVVDRTSRLRNTLLHEMCHAAAWIVHGYREGHGVLFKFWGQRAYKLLEIEVKTYHTYVIEAKYIYRCQGCANEVRRHSKSLDMSRYICRNCKGRFELYVNDKRTNQQTPASERKQSAFSKFVKDEYKVVKAKNPDLKHGEIMSALSELWKTMKNNV